MKVKLKISAIIPAHNEEGRISSVLETLISSKLFDEIIVVNDASTDKTSNEVKKNFSGVRLISKKKSNGKADAMILGAKKAKNEIIFFCDADLINLKKTHLESLINPVISGKLRMSVGAQEYMQPLKKKNFYRKIKSLFNNFGGNGRPYLNDFVKGMGGERVLWKNNFLKIKEIVGSGYGVEQEMNRYYEKNNLKFDYFVLTSVSHFPKIEKWGLFRGSVRQLAYYFTASHHLIKYLWDRLIN